MGSEAGESDQEVQGAVVRNWREELRGRLGLEPQDVFEDVADVVGHPGSVNLMVWLFRAPEDRTPECMGFEAFHDDSGFRYRWTA